MTHRTRAAALLSAMLLVACSSAPSISPTPGAPTLAPADVTLAPSPSPSPSASPSTVPTDGPTAADLDGVLTTIELAHRVPIAVSIDDAKAARPQSGFNGASIVYHAPADGYEARYLLVFQEGDSTAIGPVRSGRIYLAQWAAEYRAALGHYGGDRLTRAWIGANSPGTIVNVDGLGAGNAAYHRIATRSAPHNAYTSTGAFRPVAVRLGAADTISSVVHLRPFRDDTDAASHPASESITIPFRTVTVGYRYDPVTDSYVRYLDGKVHIDPMDNQQVTARTVVVMTMPFHTDSTIEPGHSRPVLGFIGHGPASVFVEGREIVATWSKAGPLDPTLILDASGHELPFVRGRIFFEIVPTGTRVSAS